MKRFVLAALTLLCALALLAGCAVTTDVPASTTPDGSIAHEVEPGPRSWNRLKLPLLAML